VFQKGDRILGKKAVSGIMLTLILVGFLALPFNDQLARTQATSSVIADEVTTASFNPPTVEWSKTYGGPSGDGPGLSNALVQTSDGGYVMAGATASFEDPDGDFWLVKTDVDGNMQWNRRYGTSGNDAGRAVVQTSDGGYAIAGSVWVGTFYYADFYLVKTDAFGTSQWSREYSETGSEQAYSLIQTKDGGYAIVGEKYSPSVGNTDLWFVKVDADGNMQWNKTYGGNGNDHGRCVIQTTDGGYVLAGFSHLDLWIIKTNLNGDKQWDRTYGGGGDDVAYSVVQTTDGGYILAGSTSSFGAGYDDVWLVKTDTSGGMQWNKTFGGADGDVGISVIQTVDGGYAVLGTTWSFGVYYDDPWLIKTDAQGNMQWDKVFEGSSNDGGHSLIQTKDKGYALLCLKSHGYPNFDFWLIKTAASVYTGDIYIRADGSVDPPTAPILRHDDVIYTVVSNINGSIVVDRSGVTLDGAGCTLRGTKEYASTGVLSYDVSDVKIQNMNIDGFYYGIRLLDTTNCNVHENNIVNNIIGIHIHHTHNTRFYDNDVANNGHGFYMESNTVNNTFFGNNIENNDQGTTIADGCWYNRFYHNNFKDNPTQAWCVSANYVNYFNNSYPSGGNYWSDYVGLDEASGPNQDQPGSDGFADTVYVAYLDTVDNYPLMNPTDIMNPHVPVTDSSIGKLPFRLEMEPVGASNVDASSTDLEVMLFLFETIGRHAELLTALTPIPEADKLVKIWYVTIVDKDGDGWEIEEIVGTLIDAVCDELAGELAQMAIEYMLDLQQSVFLQEAYASLLEIGSAFWMMRQVVPPLFTAAAYIFIGLFNPIKPMVLPGFSINGYGEPWTILGYNMHPLDGPYAKAACPVDLEIVDSEGRVVNKTLCQIPGAFYLEADLNGDGDVDDLIRFSEEMDDYVVSVIPEAGANENDTYTLLLGNEGLGLMVENNGTIGNIPEDGYSFKTCSQAYLDAICDVAVSNVTLFKNTVGEGLPMKVNATIQNQGKVKMNATLNLCANGTIVDTIANITLAVGNSSRESLIWNTTGFAKGNYTLTAETDPISYEVDTADNIALGGVVLVSTVGDINGDRLVNIRDIHLFGKVFNATPLDPLWVAEADVNDDLIINTQDLHIMNAHYGQSW
jgi:parallel beta-helix repeat protein